MGKLDKISKGKVTLGETGEVECNVRQMKGDWEC